MRGRLGCARKYCTYTLPLPLLRLQPAVLSLPAELGRFRRCSPPGLAAWRISASWRVRRVGRRSA